MVAAAGGIALTIVLAAVAGLALLSRRRAVRAVSRVYVEVFRGTSEVVQLFWIFFVLPALVGYQIIPLGAGILVLGLNHGAYGAEIVRGAVQAVPRAQYEGSLALSLSPYDRMTRVILPQALVEMLPPFNNLFIQLLKSTALLSLVVVDEVVRQGQLLVPNLGVGETLTIYLVELVIFLLLGLGITAVMRLLERRAAARLGRTPVTRARVGEPA
ncbi:ectoine/hydroxyectoine ABC transporter permease subunit EhuC [Pseudonocardia sp. CNS-139]|nr:ectoine/hydroxyectoine ABC transporter permease subunit EhuC [Pseudonocardia sp. CNS-139]